MNITKEDLFITDSIMDMNKVIQNIPEKIPILLLHGTDDKLIPVADAFSYKGCRDSIDQARHAFRGKRQIQNIISNYYRMDKWETF